MERRLLASPNLGQLRVAVRSEDGDSRTLAGYGAVYFREHDQGTQYQLWTDTVERIMPGAFDRAIREDDVRGLFNHDADNILGRTAAGTMRLSVDDVGLRYEIDAPDTDLANRVIEAVNRGDVSGSSFAFLPRSVTWREEMNDEEQTVYIREINEVELFDTGPVTYPAFESTTAGTRSAFGIDEVQAEFAKWAEDWRQRSAARVRRNIRARLVELGLS